MISSLLFLCRRVVTLKDKISFVEMKLSFNTLMKDKTSFKNNDPVVINPSF